MLGELSSDANQIKMHNSPKGGKQYINLFPRKQHGTSSKTKFSGHLQGLAEIH